MSKITGRSEFAQSSLKAISAASASHPAPVPQSINVLIIHNNPIVGEGLRSLLAEINVGGEVLYAAGIEPAMDVIRTNEVDLVLVELPCCDENDFEGLGKIRACDPDISIVVLSTTPSAQTVRDAIHGGADGYIVETAPRDVFLQAVHLSITGQHMVLLPSSCFDDPEGGRRRISAVQMGDVNAIRDRYETLTAKEADVLGLIHDGLSNKEIARELGVFEGTVKVHVKAIFRKLKAKNRTVAALMASALET